MKIVDYNTFVKTPKGTLYSTYEPCIFGEIRIKHEVIEDDGFIIDWWYQELVNNPDWDYAEQYDISSICKVMEDGLEVPPDFDILQRDGMHDYDRKFLIYSKEDVQAVINKLKSLLINE